MVSDNSIEHMLNALPLLNEAFNTTKCRERSNYSLRQCDRIICIQDETMNALNIVHQWIERFVHLFLSNLMIVTNVQPN